MFDFIGLGRRLWWARKALERRRGGDVTYEELAALVSKTHGGRSFAAPQMSDYEKAKHPPKLDAVLAWAQACDVDPGWLAFGDDTEAKAPAGVAIPEPPRAGIVGRSAGPKRGAKRRAG